MPKQWVDWTDHKPGEPEAADSAPLKKTGKGSEVISEQFADLVSSLSGMPKAMRQPTNAEAEAFLKRNMPGLAIDKNELEQMRKADDARWNGTFNNFFEEAKNPIETQNKPFTGRGPIKDEVLTEEEERIRQIRTAMDSEDF